MEQGNEKLYDYVFKQVFLGMGQLQILNRESQNLRDATKALLRSVDERKLAVKMALVPKAPAENAPTETSTTSPDRREGFCDKVSELSPLPPSKFRGLSVVPRTAETTAILLGGMAEKHAAIVEVTIGSMKFDGSGQAQTRETPRTRGPQTPFECSF